MKAHRSATKKNNNIDPQDTRLLQKRKIVFLVAICTIALSWYGVTAIESIKWGYRHSQEGCLPGSICYFMRSLSQAHFGNVFGTKCPKCGNKMKTRGMPLYCPDCGFGKDSDPPRDRFFSPKPRGLIS
jgi:hypothetical protein